MPRLQISKLAERARSRDACRSRNTALSDKIVPPREIPVRCGAPKVNGCE
jgi:hypothetical protein